VIASCYRCKQFQVTAYHNPPVGNVPLDRTVGSTHFEVLGVDYAGPLIYIKINKTKDAKAYILLFAYSPTHSIHLELLPDQTTDNLSKGSSDLLQEGDVHGKFTRTMVKFLFQLRNGPVI
jgi:hypothetical protein